MTLPEHERDRLAGVYSAMSDGELEKLAASAFDLSDVARETLTVEIARRRLNVPLATTQIDERYDLAETVTLRQFRDLPDALLAKGSLESAGIEAYLVDDNMVRMDWFISNLLGGIKLKVRAEDVEAASEILNQPIPAMVEVEGVGEYEQPKCPSCQALDISYRELKKGPSYWSAYAGVPVPVYRKAWTCHACGHEWDDQDIVTEDIATEDRDHPGS